MPPKPRGIRKRQRQPEDATTLIDNELEQINDLLQNEDTSQKQIWQIGKRIKKLLETHASMDKQKQIDAHFLWGTALSRLASLNEDPALAEGAVDKFEQMHELSQGDDSALGPVGYSLWASSLLTIATEKQSVEVLDKALRKFEVAVEVDGGTTFESRFQHAKALKEGGDLVKFLAEAEDTAVGKDDHVKYYKKALEVCAKLAEIYDAESAKNDDAKQPAKPEDDNDDDSVSPEDFAEVKLLEAIVHSLLETTDMAKDDFERTFQLFQEALTLSPGNPEALMELANYTAQTYVKHVAAQTKLVAAIEWAKVFADIEADYKRLLTEVGFDLAECHEICERKDGDPNAPEPEEEELDASVPHLLHSLGKALGWHVKGQVMALQHKEKQVTVDDALKKQFVHAVEVLRSAHHYHDKLGCYPLACLFALPGFEDEKQCRTWLETSDSYGILDDEFNLDDFGDMKDKEWIQPFTQPAEEVNPADEQNELEIVSEMDPTREHD
ncbi:TPA: hypothetical protein N0F65_005450 [Lagenidium giganteum]|uniref:TPR-like protein n=1 Tax=Lagenidium giganteum TaxID=4803 RepID=A0AAV2Z1N9_9STRA|nr:TPA: hypothetical protein N0F65_005450 [Lagenidium giganteum]